MNRPETHYTLNFIKIVVVVSEIQIIYTRIAHLYGFRQHLSPTNLRMEIPWYITQSLHICAQSNSKCILTFANKAARIILIFHRFVTDMNNKFLILFLHI